VLRDVAGLLGAQVAVEPAVGNAVQVEDLFVREEELYSFIEKLRSDSKVG
jgi:hypothetical protein